jgi:hypothetical protein
MTAIKSFALGTFTVLVFEIALVFLLNAVGLAQHWGSGRVALGGLVIFLIQRSSDSFSVSMGPGVLVLAAGLGLLNGGGAYLLNRTNPA